MVLIGRLTSRRESKATVLLPVMSHLFLSPFSVHVMVYVFWYHFTDINPNIVKSCHYLPQVHTQGEECEGTLKWTLIMDSFSGHS